MARQIQIRRGTAAEHENFTGALGEITMDTTNKTLRVHDGTTVGGTVLAKQNEIPTVPQLPDNMDYVIETQLPTATNSYTWYRKYKSGWVEMGGKKQTNISTVSVDLPISFSDTNYDIIITQGVFANSGSDIRTRYIQSKTTSSFSTSCASGIPFCWCAYGFIE